MLIPAGRPQTAGDRSRSNLRHSYENAAAHVVALPHVGFRRMSDVEEVLKRSSAEHH